MSVKMVNLLPLHVSRVISPMEGVPRYALHVLPANSPHLVPLRARIAMRVASQQRVRLTALCVPQARTQKVRARVLVPCVPQVSTQIPHSCASHVRLDITVLAKARHNAHLVLLDDSLQRTVWTHALIVSQAVSLLDSQQ